MYEGFKQKSDNKLAADLIIDVLVGKKTVDEAVSLFPKDGDINIKCAFDALVHREADEDLRAKIKDYALVQDEYLEQLAQLLKENKKLPQNIIQDYMKFHETNLLSPNLNFTKSVMKNFKRMINF